MRFWWFPLALALVAVAADARAQAPPTVTREGDGTIFVRAVRTSGEMRTDGRLDEEIYGVTPAISDFVQQEPDEFAPATEKTEAWVMFDEDNIVVLIDFHQQKHQVTQIPHFEAYTGDPGTKFAPGKDLEWHRRVTARVVKQTVQDAVADGSMTPDTDALSPAKDAINGIVYDLTITYDDATGKDFSVLRISLSEYGFRKNRARSGNF